MHRLIISIVVFLSIECVTSFTLRQSQNDDMCKAMGGLLCMKEELTIIATVAQGIVRESNRIEESILQTKVLDTLKKYVDKEYNHTYSSLPTQEYHNEYFRRSNIDKEFLTQLFFEAHDAIVFFYNSIDDILDLKVEYAEMIDHSLRKIQNNLRYEIICRYRSALHVFSHKWKSAHDIGRMNFSKHRLTPSILHDVHSIVVLRNLQTWMETINSVLVNLERKLN